MLLFFHLLTLHSSFEAGGCRTRRNSHICLSFCYCIAQIFMWTYKLFIRLKKAKPKRPKYQTTCDWTHNRKLLLTSCKEKAYEALLIQ